MKSLPCLPSDWPRFSALLDECLDLKPSARANWFDALSPMDAQFRESLRAMLVSGEQRCSGDWLNTPASGGETMPPNFIEGQRIGPWRLLRPLGSGGMGAVWLAERADGAYAREVALKLPHAHLLNGALRDRFRRERDILAALSDPRIARFYDAGIGDDEEPWLALEYVEGMPITSYCESRAPSVRQRVALLRDVATAVQAAHARLIVHRDLKPANVLVTADGQVKLLDFGIAKLLDDDASESALTQLGARAATPDYAAPEQLCGGAVTVATDVYALGVMLYELLTGQRPFATRSRLGRLIENRGDAPLASTRTSGPQRAALAGDVDAILARAMEPDPAKRYASVEAFSDDLGRYLAHQPIQARRIGRWQRAAKFMRRHKQGVGIAAALVLMLTTGVAGVIWQAQRTAEEARRASAIKDFLIEIFAANDPRIASDQPRGSITAKTLLDNGAKKIESRFADDPVVQIELLRTIADLYAQLGEDERYETLQALQLRKSRAHFGPLHANIINGAVEAALRACNRGERNACAKRIVEADRLLKASGDGEPELRAHWWMARGQQLQGEDGRIDDAERAYKNATYLYRKHAPRSRGHVTALHELAGFYTSMKSDYARAIATYLETLALAESLPDRNDAELQTLYGNLGLVYQQLGQFADAAKAFRRSADYADRTTGAEFPTAWGPRVNAARTMHLAGQREAAHREFARLLPLLPDDGRYAKDVAAVRELYGERVSSEGRPDVAIPHLEASVAAYAKQATFAFKFRLTRRYLGEAYARAGRHDDAGRVLKASLDEYLREQRDSEQPVMAIRESWGRWLLDDGKFDDARKQFEIVVAHAEGQPLSHVALAHGGLARAALARNDHDTGLRESETALAIWGNVSGFRDVRMEPYLLRVRADALAAVGRIEPAQALEDRAAADSRRYDHPDSPSVIRRTMAAMQ
jgi:eukaryotic-like serine/threonine-protein kinase